MPLFFVSTLLVGPFCKYFCSRTQPESQNGDVVNVVVVDVAQGNFTSLFRDVDLDPRHKRF